jgi:hypothetical protein
MITLKRRREATFGGGAHPEPAAAARQRNLPAFLPETAIFVGVVPGVCRGAAETHCVRGPAAMI